MISLSSETISVLNNFAEINPSIVIKAGNTIKTMSTSKTVVGVATVTESFPCDFAIYDLGQFLSVLGMFKEPSLKFEPNRVVISGGKAEVKYTYSSPDNIVTFNKEIKTKDFDISFELTPEDTKAVIKACKVFGSNSEFIIKVKKGKVYLSAGDVKNDTAHSLELMVGDTESKDLLFRFNTSKLKLLPHTYTVSATNGIAKFESKDANLIYWIASETEAKK